jgi:arylsulfatase A-like enzyme
MIAQVDDQLARLLDCLDATGQRDDTLVIFTSDHGESLGDHGLLYKGCRFYEGLVRVPLIFRWPGRVQAGVRSDALVELLDKTATIVDVAGAGGLEELQGRSLWPLLAGQVSPEHHRDFVRSEYYDALDPAFIGSGSPDTPGSTAAATSVAGEETPAGTYGTMYRDQRYKLSVYHGHEIGELFDLETDPWEFENLWNDPASAGIKTRLLKASFDASIRSGVDVGTRRIAPM